MRLRSIMMPWVLLSIAAPVGGQQAVPGNAATTLQASLLALGGSPNKFPSSYVAVGTGTDYAADGTAQPTYPVQIEILTPDKFRWVVQSHTNVVATTINGPLGQVQANAVTNSVAAARLCGKAAASVPLFALSQWLAAPSLQAELIGPEVIGEQNLIHIAVKGVLGLASPGASDQAPGDWYEIYIDPQTSLPVRIRYYQPIEGTPGAYYLSAFVPVDLAFSDFRSVNGLLFPFAITRFVNNQQSGSIQFQSIQLNVPVNVSDFSLNP